MAEFLGRYELLTRLAGGGMGEVFLARQQGPVGFEKFLVIKTLLPHLTEDQDFVNMFFDEARIAALLTHPNIAHIYELGEESGRYYLAMEYVHGKTLGETVDAAQGLRGGMMLGLKCRVISSAAEALNYAHDACNAAGQHLGLIHRDVSPSNLMISFSGEVKLVDFGIAKANNKLVRTATGVIRGKYAYMSPEQAYAEPLDRRSDVFALGIVFHELLTGQRLFKRETENETLAAVVEAKIAAPSSLAHGVPKALDAVVMKALARKKSDRYPSCAQLHADLEGVIKRQRLPATMVHLAGFMQALFPTESAPGALLKYRPPPGSEGDLTPLSVSVPRPAQAPGSTTAPASFDSQQLEDRVRACGPGDQIYGLFLNAVESAVLKQAGSAAGAELRKAAHEPKAWVDSLRYSTPEFLRLLWRGVEVLAPRCGGLEPAFVLIGQQAFEALLRSPLGAPLISLPPRTQPRLLVRPLIQLIQPMIRPGTRVVTDTGERSSEVVFKGEVLPLQVYAGILRAAFEHFAAPLPELSWERTMPERVELQLRWP